MTGCPPPPTHTRTCCSVIKGTVQISNAIQTKTHIGKKTSTFYELQWYQDRKQKQVPRKRAAVLRFWARVSPGAAERRGEPEARASPAMQPRMHPVGVSVCRPGSVTWTP